MNKYFLTTISLLFFTTSNTFAQNTYIPYVGVDTLYGRIKASQNKPTHLGASFNIGSSYNDFFGTEIFYQQVGSDCKKISPEQKLKTSYRAYGLDTIAYIPLDKSKKISLTAGLGVGEYVFYKKIKPDKHHTSTALGYRFNFGAAYNLTQNVTLRPIFRYTYFKKTSSFDHELSYGLGIRYNFIKD